MPTDRKSIVPAVVLSCLFVIVARPATAQDSVRADTARRLRDLEAVGSVVGTGRPRAAASVPTTALREAIPGTSPLRLLDRVPGVNVQYADPFGQYEWANRVTIRGFQTQQIGQTFDGITLGDMSYANYNGFGIGRAIDPDNLASVRVAQGSGALGTASSNNLGGVIEYVSGDPANRGTFTVRQMAGQARARRTALRYDTGALGLGGGGLFKAYVSLSRSDSDKWKGTGERWSPFPYGSALLLGEGGLFGAGMNWRDQLNVKAVALLGAHRVTAFYDYTDGKEHGYTDLSLDRWRTVGRDWDQYATWDAAKTGATSTDPDAAYFHASQGARRDHFAYVAGDLALAENARLTVTPYLHIDRGAGDWYAPSYGSTAFPDPIMFRQTQFANERYGATARGTWTVAGQTVEAGGWVEDNRARQRRPRYRLQDYAAGPAVDFGDVLQLDFDRTADLTTAMLYVQNRTPLLRNRLVLTYGVKWLSLGADFRNNGNTPTDGVIAARFSDTDRPSLSVPTHAGVLPQLGAVFALGEGRELFASAAENISAFPYNPVTGIYGTSPTGFATFVATAKPERATTFDLGVRTHGPRLETSLAAYHVAYRNRLVPLTVCPPTVSCNSSFANVGSVHARGFEGLLDWHPVAPLGVLLAASWNLATYASDYVANAQTGEVVAAAGKDVIDAPRVLVTTGLRVAHRGAFGGVTGRYVDRRYITIVNDVSVPPSVVFDANAGYRAPGFAGLRELTFEVNVVNLLDNNYIATVGAVGFLAQGGTGSPTIDPGTRRLGYVSVVVVP